MDAMVASNLEENESQRPEQQITVSALLRVCPAVGNEAWQSEGIKKSGHEQSETLPCPKSGGSIHSVINECACYTWQSLRRPSAPAVQVPNKSPIIAVTLPNCGKWRLRRRPRRTAARHPAPAVSRQNFLKLLLRRPHPVRRINSQKHLFATLHFLHYAKLRHLCYFPPDVPGGSLTFEKCLPSGPVPRQRRSRTGSFRRIGLSRPTTFGSLPGVLGSAKSRSPYTGGLTINAPLQ